MFLSLRELSNMLEKGFIKNKILKNKSINFICIKNPFIKTPFNFFNPPGKRIIVPKKIIVQYPPSILVKTRGAKTKFTLRKNPVTTVPILRKIIGIIILIL
jgi:hypothetical protein